MTNTEETPTSFGMKHVTMWTDGSVYKNGKEGSAGGWGVVLEYGKHRREMCGGVDSIDTGIPVTNQRMELTAPIMGLGALKGKCKVTITTDSKYVQYGFHHWSPGWLERNWKNRQGEPVANRDLWEQLLSFKDKHEIEFVWVKGHANGNDKMYVENNRADVLASIGKQSILDDRLKK